MAAPTIDHKSKSRIPEGIDTTALTFLQKGDVTRVASELKEDPNYVSRVKVGKSYNVKILSALIKRGLENKKSLNP